jgi:hypothetical protein
MNKRKITKNAQVQMGETIAIMFVFFLLIIVGVVFYVRISTTSTYRTSAEQFERQSVEITQTISFLPELQCSESNVVTPNCFDFYKMEAMSQLVNDPKVRAFYLRDLGKATVYINTVYPEEANFTVYDNHDTNYTDASLTHIPISVYDSVNDKYNFGVMVVTIYR